MGKHFACWLILLIVMEASCNSKVPVVEIDYAAYDSEDLPIIQMQFIRKNLEAIRTDIGNVAGYYKSFTPTDFALALSAISQDVSSFSEDSKRSAEQISSLRSVIHDDLHSRLDELQRGMSEISFHTDMKILERLDAFQETLVKLLESQPKARDKRCAIKSGSPIETTVLASGIYHYHVSKSQAGILWRDALQYCKNRGMELVALETADEMSEVWDKSRRGLDYWTSGTDFGSKPNLHRWLDTGELVDSRLKDPASAQGSCISLAGGKLFSTRCEARQNGLICELPTFCA